MKFTSILLVVDNIEISKKFYCDIFGLTVTMDFGANITLNDILSLQSKNTWAEFIEKDEKEIVYKGNDAELYFDEENFDEFLEKLNNYAIEYVHKVKEHEWGQRVVRFYDPDKHIIEVGEDMKVVCRRFLEKGLSIEETAKRTQFPIKFVKACLSN